MAKGVAALPPTETRTVNYGSRQVAAETNSALEEASRDFAGTAGISVDGQGRVALPDPGHAAGRSRDLRFEGRMKSLKARVNSTGLTPATVFNFLPIRPTVCSPSIELQKGVPAVTGDAPYATRSFTELDIQIIDEGELGKTPQEFHPIQVARVYEHEYPHGGVIALPIMPEDANLPRWKKILDEHAEKAVTWMVGQCEIAERLWNAPDRLQRQNVRSIHRACGHRLVALGIYQELPDFCVEKRETKDVPDACGRCGKRPPNRMMVQCDCGWILDPAAAFERDIIQEDDEALERLTRAQVKELGISAYVAETVDEKPERLKTGEPKRYSEAAIRALAAKQREQTPPFVERAPRPGTPVPPAQP